MPDKEQPETIVSDKTLQRVKRLSTLLGTTQNIANKAALTFKKSMNALQERSIAAQRAQEDLKASIEEVSNATVKAYKDQNTVSYEANKKELKYLQTLQRRKELIEGIKSATVKWGTTLLAANSMHNLYNRLIEEGNLGQRLFLADLSQIGKGTEEAFKNGPKYVNAYMYALRGNYAMAAKYQTSVEEVESTMKTLSFSMRGQVSDLDQLGPKIKSTTEELYQFTRLQNIDVNAALEEFNKQLYGMGSTVEGALDSFAEIGIAQNKLQLAMEKGGFATKQNAAVWKEDFYQAIKNARENMPGVILDTRSLSDVVGKVGLAAAKSGLTYDQLVSTMSKTPQLLKEIPTFFKINMGSELIGQWRRNQKEFYASLHIPPDKLENIKGQMENIMSLRTDPVSRTRMVQELISGTGAGITGALKIWKNLSPTYRTSLMKKVIGEEEFFKGGQGATLLRMIESNKFEEAGGKITDIQASAKKRAETAKKEREEYKNIQKKTFNTLNSVLPATHAVAKEMEGLKSSVGDLMTSNYAIIASNGALIASQHAKGLFSLLSRGAKGGGGILGGLMGGAGAAGAPMTGSLLGKGGILRTPMQELTKGGLKGALGAAAGVGMAFTVGYEAGTFIDKWLGASDKIVEMGFAKRDVKHKKELEQLNKQLSGTWVSDLAKNMVKFAGKGKKELEVSKIDRKTGKVSAIATEKIALTRESASAYLRDLAKAKGMALSSEQLEALVQDLPTKIMEGAKHTTAERVRIDAIQQKSARDSAISAIKNIPVSRAATFFSPKDEEARESRMSPATGRKISRVPTAGQPEVPSDWFLDPVSQTVNIKFNLGNFSNVVAASNKQMGIFPASRKG